MTVEQIKQFIQGGELVNIAVELRPRVSPTATGKIHSCCFSRAFTYSPGEKLECRLINCANR